MPNNKTPRIPSEYTPISRWGYFGYQILFSIPVIGWIFIIVFALTAPNQNLKNFARSQFCVMILWLFLVVIMATSGLFVSMMQNLM